MNAFQEPIPIVEMFLADYLQMWNGHAYQMEILQLIGCSLHLQHFEGTNIFKPGARGLRPRAPGFLKLLWSTCRYACVCVCVRPRGH